MKMQNLKFKMKSLKIFSLCATRCMIHDTRYTIQRLIGLTIVFLLPYLASCILYPASVDAEDKGPLISIELRDVELSDVLRALGQEHGINVIVDEKVTGKVTVSLRNIPLWDAIDSILKDKGYAYIKDGDIVRVLSAGADEDLMTYTATVKYANAKDIEPVITKVLSKRGSLASDPKSNMIVIRDIPSAIERVTRLLNQVDVKTKQIMIEAKIVEVSTNASQELGIQWGAKYTRADATVKGVGTTTTGTTTGGLTSSTGISGNPFIVNLPAAVGAGAGGALGIAVVSSRAALDLQISALETQGNAKTLSNPKVVVLDNQKATIASGEKITLRTSTTTTTGTTSTPTTVEAALRLTVTPKVIDNDHVSLKISTKKEAFDRSRTVDGIPSTLSRETDTEVIVKNGETIVIGGIYTETETEAEDGVPLLSKIPILGWLFKKETKTKDKIELLIFITPRIKTEEI